MTFFTHARQYPPLIVRLMAKRKPYGPPMLDAEIVQDSGLQPGVVFDLSMRMTWDGIDLPTLEKFTKACRMDFTSGKDMRRARQYLQKKPVTWKYLRQSPHWKSQFEPLALILKRWGESRR